ncbi:MAG: hypothetical protein KIS94_06810 [Chitinophagales bacterium]|nr:hypothetical protein [Chitinophagales bacterium]
MELIISILMALGFIGKENQSFNLDKLKTTEVYQKFYEKAGADLDQDPQAWAEVLKGK